MKGNFVNRAYWVLALVMIMALALPWTVLADDISNNLDGTVDAVAELMALDAGGAKGTTTLYLVERNGDGKNGCNLTGSTTLVLSISSDNTSAASVNPTSVTFRSCGDRFDLSVTPVAQGSADIIVGLISKDAPGTFDLAPATFTVNVAASATNTAPQVSITGPTGGASYEFGSVPAATCSITDAEDGNSSFAATLSAVSGPLSAYGLGEQTASCSYTDHGGLTASASVTYGIVDTTGPVINLVSRTPSSGNGWNNDDVEIVWSCTDNVAVDTGKSILSQTVSTEGENQTSTGTCTDVAGNNASDTQSGINIDKTAPTTNASASPAANANGWNNTDVTVSFSGGDGSGSGIDFCDADVVLSSEGAGQSASGTCTDKAGNKSDPAMVSDINIDKTAPTLTFGDASPAANDYGWNNTDVSFAFTTQDNLSGVDISNPTSPLVVAAEGAAVSGQVVVTDKAGNSATFTSPVVKIDKTAPTISYVGRTPQANSYGWNKDNVTVNWSCADTLSGPVADSVNQTLTDEGANQSTTGTCTDQAGNAASDTQSGINIDKTAPTVSLVGGPADGGSYYFGSVPAAPTCTASDTLSDLAGPCSVTGYSTAVGPHPLIATATDKAGNTASASASYTVLAWDLKGFYKPVDMTPPNSSTLVWNTVKSGSTVPLKFEAFAGPTELTDIAIVSTFTAASVACTAGTEDAIEELVTATGGTALRYDSTAGQFVYNWKTQGKAASCYRVTMTTQDASSLVVYFKLK